MNALHGLRIVLTRPAGQTALIAARIRAAGGEVLTLPLLDIIPPTEAVVPEVLQAQMARADEVVFISPNAVRMALQVLPAADWPPDCGLVAVGQGTARALREAGIEMPFPQQDIHVRSTELPILQSTANVPWSSIQRSASSDKAA